MDEELEIYTTPDELEAMATELLDDEERESEDALDMETESLDDALFGYEDDDGGPDLEYGHDVPLTEIYND